MLEKLGLPPKPSLRGNSWVVDASHCQGCSSHFTFINRKHHCRRCGGIFCNSCSQQRMVLRGQGDSPVRICEPCKKLEEAARFELRYGCRSRDAKGGSKHASKKGDEILRDILANNDKISPTEITSASCSYATPTEGGDIVRNPSLDQPGNMKELESVTPEDMRQQALVEKQKYKNLKAEGKSEEALRAFKRGKELERQAGALELSLRKNRRKALSSSNIDDIQQIIDDFNAPAGKNNKLPTKKGNEADNLSAELKDLGWSDRELRDAEKMSATLSVEGELSSPLRDFSQKPKKEKVTVSSGTSQVIAHKKRALDLKRAGNIVEAKEELKRAKILERKIEEDELLGEAGDSDDELALLIRSMDGDERERGFDFLARHNSDLNFNFDHFTGIGGDLAVDGNFEVTEEDMYDPEINSALASLGWIEESSDRESIATEIQSLKREALNQKRAGNTADAMSLLKKAKLLEKEPENYGNQEMEEPFFSTWASANDMSLQTAPKSKLIIQKELLALKKKALSLRREGKFDESAEQLEKAKALEEQLVDMDKAPPVVQQSIGSKQRYKKNINTNNTLGNKDAEDVTDQDLYDPAYLTHLKNLGWEDEDNAEVPSTTSKENNGSSNYMSDSSITRSVFVNTEIGMSGSKSEIRRELLMLKRKAVALRRQGEAEQADEVLKMAKLLEDKLHEFGKQTQKEVSPENNERDSLQNTKSALQVDPPDSRVGDSERQAKDKVVIRPEKPYDIVHGKEEPNLNSLQQDSLAYKKKAISLNREGQLAEAKEALRQAKLLEKQSTEDEKPQTTTNPSDSSVNKEASPSSVSKPLLSSRDRFKLQQESLGHKRQALKLRREGRTAEADSEFELAKTIETCLQESDPCNSSGSAELAENVDVEDFLDPQLLLMLQSVGLDDGHARSQCSDRIESTTKLNADANVEREQLTERIKVEKVKAVNLKRLGKQAEALDALRRAKLYERKLQALPSK